MHLSSKSYCLDREKSQGNNTGNNTGLDSPPNGLLVYFQAEFRNQIIQRFHRVFMMTMIENMGQNARLYEMFGLFITQQETTAALSGSRELKTNLAISLLP